MLDEIRICKGKNIWLFFVTFAGTKALRNDDWNHSQRHRDHTGYARGRTDPLAASAKSVEIVFQGIGLFTLAIGISMSLKSANLLLAVLSLVIGGLIGQALNLDRHLRQLTERLQRIAKKRPQKLNHPHASPRD